MLCIRLTAAWQAGPCALQLPSSVKATEKQSPLSTASPPRRSHEEGALGVCSFSLLPAFLPIGLGHPRGMTSLWFMGFTPPTLALSCVALLSLVHCTSSRCVL